MSEQTEGQIVIEAPAVEVMDVLTDFEAYPEWADVKSARVLERGDGGLGTKVAFEVDVPLLGRRERDVRNRFRLPPGLAVANMLPEGYGDVPAVAGG